MATKTNNPWTRHLPTDDGQYFIVSLVLVFFAGLIGLLVYHELVGDGLRHVDQQPPGSIEYVVDVNTASWPELAQLPGIGETLARRIVASREKEGPYHRADDLLRVRGIGKILFSRMQPHVKVFVPSDTGHQTVNAN